MDFLGIGWGEILFVLIIALILWGPGKIIEISRTLGKTVHAFKKAASDLSTQVSKELEEQKKVASHSEQEKNQVEVKQGNHG